MVDRDTFAKRQAAMTSNWYEGVKKREGDVDAYIAKRHFAYIDRWKEAGRFIPDSSRLLDVGGGNLFPQLLQYFKSRQLDYHYIDVDPEAVDNSRKLAIDFGFSPEKFSEGFNDRFNYDGEYFDAIFSSHCIEHSIDLRSTFKELNRILKMGGNLLMAVPLGWEENPEHPYFFAPEHWVTLAQDAGFDIRIAQLGKEYPETGYDFFIAARKVSTVRERQRIYPDDYRKELYSFVRFDDPRISYHGDMSLSSEGNAAHLRGNDWVIHVDLGERYSQILPILLRHDWSAEVAMSSKGSSVQHFDLFSWFPYVQPCVCIMPDSGDVNHRLQIAPVGKNPASHSTEAVLYGFMYR